MKNNKDGASETFEQFLGRNDRLDAYNKRTADLPSGGDYKSGYLNPDGAFQQVADDSVEFRSSKAFEKFNASAKQNTNPFGNASALRAQNAQNELDNLNVGNSARMAREAGNDRDAMIEGKGDTQEDLATNPQTILPVAGPPMSNGTGSSRPNFEKGVSMDIKKVNEGGSMSEVLFNKK